ncbi:MAG: hypothetical protein QNK19_01005 [Xanthomonadales bacterium]|nr:hypothetical protein [Xanthomonadales bacterium]
MKLFALIVTTLLLISGCANFPGGGVATSGTEENGTMASTGSSASQSSTAAVRERKVNIGNWLVDCLYEETRFQTQCKAETYGKITHYLGDEIYQPTPILWVSWMKGEDPDKRTVCVLGHNYPVNAVSFAVDNNPPLQLVAGTASGCFISNQTLINQLRKGQLLVVSFLRFPWGETKVSFDLNRSNQALNELKTLVAAQ